jgi:hypothetical protein
MAEFVLSPVTIPTPQPYAKNEATRNSENFYYAMLQILQIIQAAGFKFGDVDKATKDGTDIKTAITNLSLSVPPADMTAIVQALKDLKYNGILIDFGVFRIEGFGKYKET